MKIYLLALILLFISNVYVNASDMHEVRDSIKKGRSMLRTEQHSKGVELLNQTVLTLQQRQDEHPDDFDTAYQLGMANFYLEHDAPALKAYARAAEIDPTDSRPWFFTGLIHRYAGNYDEAEKALLKAAEIAPKDADSWYELGVLYYNAENDQKAISAFKQAVAINPKHTQASYKLALNYMDAGEAEKAYPLLADAVRKQPENINAQYNFGQLCQNMGKTEEARTAFQKVSDMDPEDWHALSKLVQLNQALGHAEARDAARQKILNLRAAGTVASLNEEPLYVRDQFKVNGQLVMALEYFELKGDRAIRYSFVVTDKTGKNSQWRITLGSYEQTNRVAHNNGDVEEGVRLFHLDQYPEDGSHYLLGFFKGEPEYDRVKPMVIKAVKGEIESLSSTTLHPSNQ